VGAGEGNLPGYPIRPHPVADGKGAPKKVGYDYPATWVLITAGLCSA